MAVDVIKKIKQAEEDGAAAQANAKARAKAMLEDAAAEAERIYAQTLDKAELDGKALVAAEIARAEEECAKMYAQSEKECAKIAAESEERLSLAVERILAEVK